MPANIFACILGLLAAVQASVITTGLSPYNIPLLSHAAGIPLANGYHHRTAIAHPGYHVAPEIRTVHQVAAAPYPYVNQISPSLLSFNVPATLEKQYVQAAVAPIVGAPVVAAYSAPLAHVAVAPIAAAVAHVAPAVGGSVDVSSQYHSQDELGRYSFGYTNTDSTRNEERDAYGRVTGSYSYVDANGHVNSQAYVADEDGFRVTGNNLPVHHVGKRSLATYPASTAPLGYGYHHLPTITHHGYYVAPKISTGHNAVAHVAAPVAYGHYGGYGVTNNVAHVASPVAHGHYGGYAVPKKGSYAVHGAAPIYG